MLNWVYVIDEAYLMMIDLNVNLDDLSCVLVRSMFMDGIACDLFFLIVTAATVATEL